MSWLNKQIAKVAPAYALKRQIAQGRLDRLERMHKKDRTFEAVQAGRLRYDMITSTYDMNSAIATDSTALRQHVRGLEFNNGFVSGPIRRIVNNVIGTGLTFQARVRADEGYRAQLKPTITEDMAQQYNSAVEFYFKQWSREADVKLQSSFYELQRIVEGALIRDGEILAINRISNKDTRMVPYCIELLEIDRLGTPQSEIRNPKIINGIEFDAEGAPSIYYVAKVHPGNSITQTMRRDDYEEIPAFNPNGTRKVMHLFSPMRPEQVRGLSDLASALRDIQDMDRYREAEIYAALEDACLTGFITSDNPNAFYNATLDSGSDEYEKVHEFAPGKFHYLRPGEGVNIHAPQRPNSQFGEMINQLMRGPSNSLDIPTEVLTQNWQGMNYSNARTVLIMFYLSCRIRQKFIAEHFCTPVYENLARALIAQGMVSATGFERRKVDYLSHVWIAPGWQWVDPVKEAQGKEIELNNNFETLTGVLAMQGKDFDETMDTRARELQKLQEIEAKYGIKFPTGNKPAAGKEAGDGKEKEDEDDRILSNYRDLM